MTLPIVDAHVHFWDPQLLRYPWLDGVPALERAFLPSDYAAATGGIPVERVVVVECNCIPAQHLRETEYFEQLGAAGGEPRIAGIVAFAPLTEPEVFERSLEVLSASPRVRGIRQNIQGEPPGFCLQRSFVDGVRAVGRRGLTFDLCVTADQLSDTLALVRECPDTRFVLDHCGKPAIRDRRFEPWSASIECLAGCENVWCKLSGLLTEADVERWQDEDLLPYATRVLDCFGMDRVMYGSDWPVVTRAGQYSDWYRFTERLSVSWSPSERRRFYVDNAVRAYGL